MKVFNPTKFFKSSIQLPPRRGRKIHPVQIKLPVPALTTTAQKASAAALAKGTVFFNWRPFKAQARKPRRLFAIRTSGGSARRCFLCCALVAFTKKSDFHLNGPESRFHAGERRLRLESVRRHTLPLKLWTCVELWVNVVAAPLFGGLDEWNWTVSRADELKFYLMSNARRNCWN